MLKRIFIALVLPALGIGCTISEHRPAVVEPRYVARCPAGYRYDGNDCHRVSPPTRVMVDVDRRY